MIQGIQEPSFLAGFAIGELTGQLKYQAPAQIKLWIPLDQLKDYTGVLQKYHYSLIGITAHPSEPNQVLLVADKVADGTAPQLIQAFAKSDRFMDGWAAGCLAGLLRYLRPEELEESVRIENLEAIQQLLDQHGYQLTSLRIHPQDQRWTQLTAQKQS